ncbi:MAG: hypothetical protein JRJ49_06550 [Deltaproteobacteria bacterium]|nr:hypothetical protein [Deltaproteobacteria bacterium]
MDLKIDVGDIIAGIALLLAVYANWRNFTLLESQKKLNQIRIENEKKADLKASFIKHGKNGYKLEICNKGNSVARNVRLEFPEGYGGIFMQNEIDSKFPLESLEKFESVKLIAVFTQETKPNHTVKFIWNDEAKKDNEKIVYPTR